MSIGKLGFISTFGCSVSLFVRIRVPSFLLRALFGAQRALLRVCSGLLCVSGFSECLHGFFECLRSHEPFQLRTQCVWLFVCAYRAPGLN